MFFQTLPSTIGGLVSCERKAIKAWSSSDLLRLPAEVVCHILAHLDHKALLNTTETCRILHRSVKESSRLQYNVELARSEMVSIFSPNSVRPPISTRLKILRSREESWRTLSWKGKPSKLDLGATGSVYEFVGGFYGNGREDERRIAGAISFFELPTTSCGIDAISGPEEVRKWTHAMGDLQVIDFTMDPSQDLLVLVAIAPAESKYLYNLHLHTLSTNEPHPNAPSTVLPSLLKEVVEDPNAPLSNSGVTVRVQVTGQFVALLVKEVLENVGAHVEIWNWEAGGNYSVGAVRAGGIDDFCFLSHSQFLLVKPSGKLEVCYFEDPKYTQRDTVPITKANYALPELAPGYMYWYISMSCNPSAGYTPGDSSPNEKRREDGLFTERNRPFYYPTPDERVHACCVYVFNIQDNNVHAFVFFVNISTFLKPVDQTQTQQPSPSADLSTASVAQPGPSIVRGMALSAADLPTTSTRPLSYPGAPAIHWEQWGPHNTRWFSECLSTDWQHALFGSRTAETIREPPRVGLQEGEADGGGIGEQESSLGSDTGETNVVQGDKPPLRRLRVRDFNANAIKRALGTCSHPSSTLSHSSFPAQVSEARNGCCTNTRVITAPSMTPTRGAFVRDIVSSLPYTEVESDVGFDVTDVMMDECRLLLLKRTERGELRGIDVLTM